MVTGNGAGHTGDDMDDTTLHTDAEALLDRVAPVLGTTGLRALAGLEYLTWTAEQCASAGYITLGEADRAMAVLVAMGVVHSHLDSPRRGGVPRYNMPIEGDLRLGHALMVAAKVKYPELRIGAPMELPTEVADAVWDAAPSRATYRQQLLQGTANWSGAGLSKWGTKNAQSRAALVDAINEALPVGWAANVPKVLSGKGQGRRWRRELMLTYMGYEYLWSHRAGN